MSDDIPEGYVCEPLPGTFPNHVGRMFHRTSLGTDGQAEYWFALRIADQHLNSWGLAHGGLIAFLAEVGMSGAAWRPGEPPVVTIELNTHFLRAPKLGDLLEIRSRASRRTRSLVFSEVHAFAAGEMMFTATGICKIIGQ